MTDYGTKLAYLFGKTGDEEIVLARSGFRFKQRPIPECFFRYDEK